MVAAVVALTVLVVIPRDIHTLQGAEMTSYSAASPSKHCNRLYRDSRANGIDIAGVTGSIPVTPTIQNPSKNSKLSQPWLTA